MQSNNELEWGCHYPIGEDGTVYDARSKTFVKYASDSERDAILRRNIAVKKEGGVNIGDIPQGDLTAFRKMLSKHAHKKH